MLQREDFIPFARPGYDARRQGDVEGHVGVVVGSVNPDPLDVVAQSLLHRRQLAVEKRPTVVVVAASLVATSTFGQTLKSQVHIAGLEGQIRNAAASGPAWDQPADRALLDRLWGRCVRPEPDEWVAAVQAEERLWLPRVGIIPKQDFFAGVFDDTTELEVDRAIFPVIPAHRLDLGDPVLALSDNDGLGADKRCKLSERLDVTADLRVLDERENPFRCAGAQNLVVCVAHDGGCDRLPRKRHSSFPLRIGDRQARKA